MQIDILLRTATLLGSDNCSPCKRNATAAIAINHYPCAAQQAQLLERFYNEQNRAAVTRNTAETLGERQARITSVYSV